MIYLMQFDSSRVSISLHSVLLGSGRIKLALALEPLTLLNAQLGLLFAEVCHRLVGSALQTRQRLAQHVEFS